MAKLLAINPSTKLTTDNTDMLNAMIDYAELRIYRELDFLATQYGVDSIDATPGNRQLLIPSTVDGNPIIIVNSAYLVTPASTFSTLGVRHPMQRVSFEWMNFFWPDSTVLGIPQFYALRDTTLFVLAPTPDAAYKVSTIGVFRPTPLYTDTAGTFISDNLPDLFVAASCVFGFGGINQNFGAMSDDPQSAQSWENQYQLLKAGVNMESLRQKSWSTGWQAFSEAPTAPQSRT